MPSSHHWKRNDTNPISGTLKAGRPLAAVDIQSATLRFHMLKQDGTLIVDDTADNDQIGDGSDGSKGKWSYDPVSADTDESGTFDGEVEVTFADATVRTFPNKRHIRITIGDDLA